MPAGISATSPLYLFLFPTLFQMLKSLQCGASLAHLNPNIQRNTCHRFVVILQCRKKCSLFSPSWPHNRRLEQIEDLFFVTYLELVMLSHRPYKTWYVYWNFSFPNDLPRPGHILVSSMIKIAIYLTENLSLLSNPYLSWSKFSAIPQVCRSWWGKNLTFPVIESSSEIQIPTLLAPNLVLS